ncbi:MAG: hypothetical protein AB1564_08345, partial [Chloroflexota bacterium]
IGQYWISIHEANCPEEIKQEIGILSGDDDWNYAYRRDTQSLTSAPMPDVRLASKMAYSSPRNLAHDNVNLGGYICIKPAKR